MEISRVGRSASVPSEKKNLSVKKDFSQSFNSQMQKKSEEQLKEMFDNIKKKGNRLAITKSYVDVKAYKKMIKEYLDSVLSFMYGVKKDISFWQTQYFITVDTIDQKLEELTQMLVNEQKDNLNVAATIDDISGLLVDIYK
ncbi:YaaR family protein [Clostridium sp. CX1]|uniref:YaaR family protein n=1 Tax=Clostridium tanneri TaxID=3037988 RepID=A0ABU4JV54_9CLOT|nr:MULTISPECIES: YaaR family protein [unclassified Clostridium]MCT8978012.1 YaaR family protein [Clostridium sp. CX1]MDW8802035.1 YaaR family protein [Clostridium sp. A1-XYC3]